MTELPMLTFEEAKSLFYPEMDDRSRFESQQVPNEKEFMNLVFEENQRVIKQREENEKRARKRINELYSGDSRSDDLKIFVVRGHWAVTNWGLLSLDSYYPIWCERVFERNWIEHMAEKNWVVPYDFLRCILYARAIYSQNSSED